MADTPDTSSPSPDAAAGAYTRWLAASVVLAVVSAVSVPLAIYVFVVPGHLGLPLDGKVAWLGGLPVWGMVESVRKARAARAIATRQP